VPGKTGLPKDYVGTLETLKERIRSERLRVTLSANAAMVLLYWDIGRHILERQAREGWGAKVIERLSHDLSAAFPDMKGLSARNLKYMRNFAEEWPDPEIVQRVVAQIPWRSQIALLEKLKEPSIRLWYAKQVIENGWSRDVLVTQIESGLHRRVGGTVNNFALTLPPEDSDLAEQVFKDPYLELKLVVEYALRGLDTPMGVAEWTTRLTEELPEELKGSLPTIEEIEAEFSGEGDAT